MPTICSKVHVCWHNGAKPTCEPLGSAGNEVRSLVVYTAQSARVVYIIVTSSATSPNSTLPCSVGVGLKMCVYLACWPLCIIRGQVSPTYVTKGKKTGEISATCPSSFLELSLPSHFSGV